MHAALQALAAGGSSSLSFMPVYSATLPCTANYELLSTSVLRLTLNQCSPRTANQRGMNTDAGPVGSGGKPSATAFVAG